jgi:hypothetical protein
MHRVLVACLVLTAVGAAAQEADAPPPDLKAVWSQLTEDERAAYRSLALDRGAFLPATPGTVGGDCPSASPEISTLPFFTSNTTSSETDTYRFGDACGCSDVDPQAPECGGFNENSGLGADVAFTVILDQDCTVHVSMMPTDEGSVDSDDLALYVMTDCEDAVGGCVGADDQGVRGAQEDVTFNAAAGTSYFIVVDGFVGNRGPFDLTITEAGDTGCSLVPVELLSFDVE